MTSPSTSRSEPSTLSAPVPSERRDPWRSRMIWIPALVASGVVVGVLATLALQPATTAPAPAATPRDDSAEAGFARDMQTHHAQAVQMSMMVRERTSDPDIRSLAYDIALTQQHQIGQMYDWLVQWDLPQTGSQDPMAWMNHTDMTVTEDMPDPEDTDDMAEMPGMDHAGEETDDAAGDGVGDAAGDEATGDDATGSAATASDQMPGMATAEDLDQLSTLRGVAVERLFLELMIEHHRGGITMAQAVLAATEDPEVRLLAQTMVTGQTAEISAMEAMLDERETPPAR